MAPGRGGAALRDDGNARRATETGASGLLSLHVIERGKVPGQSVATRGRSLPLRIALRVLVALLLVGTGGLIGFHLQPPVLRQSPGVPDPKPGDGSMGPVAVPATGRAEPAEGKAGASTTAPVRRFVAGLGRIIPETEVVTVATPFGSGDARIASIEVREGDRVVRGGVLAVLDNEPQLKAALASAEAAVEARRAMLAQARATTLAARNEARAALARAQSVARNAETEFERVQELRRRGFAADQTFDQRRTAREEADREVDRLRATLSRYGDEDIERQVDVVVAARNVDAALADLARAEADLQKAYVRAPIEGTVLSVANRPGERPATSGILNLGALDRMKVEVEVYQTLIGRVELGQEVMVTAEALPEPLRGTVTRIGLEVGRQVLVDPNPAANTDARVVKVTATLNEVSSAIAARFTNLQVTARILPGAVP